MLDLPWLSKGRRRDLKRACAACSSVPDTPLEPQGTAITKNVLRCQYGLSVNVSRVRARTADAMEGEVMGELLALAGINVTVTVAFAAFIWRNQVQAERRNDAAHADLSRRIDGLTTEVAGVGQRLARLEGWIERDRVGQEQS